MSYLITHILSRDLNISSASIALSCQAIQAFSYTTVKPIMQAQYESNSEQVIISMLCFLSAP